MCQVNNERERNILGEKEDQIGRETIRWRRRRKKKEKKVSSWETEKEKKNLQFSVFRPSEVDRMRIKVVLLDESYE